ncbi:hypothetical protein SHAM105786_01820 [Shewanella amazonensis]|uniref:Cardiolipin synthase N-terminal domain-containing protein n=1 Tax=Shewanella amazonensis (strain ATCC BAA-1098 / SB2B) TaxID=326297 RepID=A1S762_SHEAM|nr:hypothetical protein [Shewanella amazonensis]ABM00219.1 conserved hypothetical protein [Shewanella amazonensis SB2B]
MEITILLLLLLLVALHCLFGYKALCSEAKISQGQKCLWCALSLGLGPAGYYFYQGLIPCDMLGRD